ATTLISAIRPPGLGVMRSMQATSTSVQLRSKVEPNGADTTVRFDYGTTPSLGSHTASRTVKASQLIKGIAVNLSGLTPNTYYYYQSDATNSAGTTLGHLQHFTTTAG